MLEARTNPAAAVAHLTRAEQNRQNAVHSTGPRTSTGKAISKLNAVKTGLTGRTVLLPSDDASRYEQHVENWIAELNPEGPRECALVQSIADAYWRAERIVRIEFALYAGGGAAVAASCEANNPGPSSEPDELALYLRHERQLRNLSVQEGRIRRSREKDMQELRDLQKERRKRVEELAAATATKAAAVAASVSTPSSQQEALATAAKSQRPTGFVFATTPATLGPQHAATTNAVEAQATTQGN
jgi:hypothetical protein